MAVNNYLCEKCAKLAVCKIYDIIAKFDDDAKKQLGVDITINLCTHCEVDE